MALIVLGFLAVGYGAEKAFDRLMAIFRNRIDTIPAMEAVSQFQSSILQVYVITGRPGIQLSFKLLQDWMPDRGPA